MQIFFCIKQVAIPFLITIFAARIFTKKWFYINFKRHNNMKTLFRPEYHPFQVTVDNATVFHTYTGIATQVTVTTNCLNIQSTK